jgi:hypothetical protein
MQRMDPELTHIATKVRDSYRQIQYKARFRDNRQATDCIRSRAEKNDTFVREFSVQLWSVKQRTTEAEEVAHS